MRLNYARVLGSGLPPKAKSPSVNGFHFVVISSVAHLSPSLQTKVLRSHLIDFLRPSIILKTTTAYLSGTQVWNWPEPAAPRLVRHGHLNSNCRRGPHKRKGPSHQMRRVRTSPLKQRVQTLICHQGLILTREIKGVGNPCFPGGDRYAVPLSPVRNRTMHF